MSAVCHWHWRHWSLLAIRCHARECLRARAFGLTAPPCVLPAESQADSVCLCLRCAGLIDDPLYFHVTQKEFSKTVSGFAVIPKVCPCLRLPCVLLSFHPCTFRPCCLRPSGCPGAHLHLQRSRAPCLVACRSSFACKRVVRVSLCSRCGATASGWTRWTSSRQRCPCRRRTSTRSRCVRACVFGPGLLRPDLRCVAA